MNTDREYSEQQTKQSRWDFRGMTVRDWLQLLIVPLALVVIRFLFTMQQDARQQKIKDQRAERELTVERAQDEALQSYLDQMSSPLLEKDLRASEEESEVRTLARARTLTVLSRLDPSRKADVIQFLLEAELVQRVEGTGPIISLGGADLSGFVGLDSSSIVVLYAVDLPQTDLRGALLNSAKLEGVRGVTNEQQEKQNTKFEDATMPDGPKRP